MYKPIFSKIFYEDVNKCYKYINEMLEAPMAAEKLKIELLEKIEYIKEKPYSRPLVQDKYLAFLGLRSIKIKNYLLFFKIIEDEDTDEKYINIFRFMYSKRDWVNIIKKESISEII
jgi:plasmid stabilization system protein ParE